jgi:LPS O-antigen subunit length determinant protein (WzzB/FepE family)
MPAGDAQQRLLVLEQVKAQNVSEMRNQETDLFDLFNDLVRKGKYIVLTTLAGMMILTGVFTFFFGEKMCEAAGVIAE